MSERTYEPEVGEENMSAYRTMIDEVENALGMCRDTIIKDSDYDWCSQFGCEHITVCKEEHKGMLKVLTMLEEKYRRKQNG